MTEVSLTIVHIREGLLRLLDKARKKIPKLPKLTQSLENHYISVPFEEDKDYLFILKCIPPFKELGDGKNKMVIACMVENLSSGITMHKFILYDTVDNVLKSFDNQERINRLTLLYEALLLDSETTDNISMDIYGEFCVTEKLILDTE